MGRDSRKGRCPWAGNATRGPRKVQLLGHDWGPCPALLLIPQMSQPFSHFKVTWGTWLKCRFLGWSPGCALNTCLGSSAVVQVLLDKSSLMCVCPSSRHSCQRRKVDIHRATTLLGEEIGMGSPRKGTNTAKP